MSVMRALDGMEVAVELLEPAGVDLLDHILPFLSSCSGVVLPGPGWS